MLLSKKTLAPRLGAYESFFRSKYFIVFALFAIWVTFFDKHSLITNYKLDQKLQAIQQEDADYQEMIKQTNAEIAEFNKDIEKFAREKFYFQKENEDVFVVVKK